MLLTIDIGNTSTSFVAYENNEIILSKRFETLKINYELYYKDILESIDLSVDCIVMSCVVPSVCKTLESLCQVRWVNAIILQVSPDQIPSFKSNLLVASEIGADFIATSIAAYHVYEKPVVVVDIGSATKITYTDGSGVFVGGVIIPGIDSSVKGLTDFIPHLPSVERKFPSKVIGNSTQAAIQSGIMFGVVAQIMGFVALIEKELGFKPVWVLTGGHGRIFVDYLPGFNYHEHLLHEGLKLIYQKELFI